jgi:hypothetical protein
MCSKIDLFAQSRSNDRHWFITDVRISALAVAFWFPLQIPLSCQCWKLKFYRHSMNWNYNTVAGCGRKPGKNVRECVGHWVCFGWWGGVLFKLRCIQRVDDTSSVLNTGGKEIRGVGGKKGYIYSTSCDVLVQLVLLVKAHKMAKLSCCTATRNFMKKKPRDGIRYSRWWMFTSLGIPLALHTTFQAQTLFILQHTV